MHVNTHMHASNCGFFIFYFSLARLSSRVPPQAHLPFRPPPERASAPIGERRAREEQSKLQGPRSEQESCNLVFVHHSRAVSDPSHAASGLFLVPNTKNQGINSVKQPADGVESYW